MDTNEIKRLVSDGHTEEAIDQLIIYGRTQSATSNIIVNISAGYHRIKASYLAGVISEDEYSQKLDKINFRILSLIDQNKNTVSVSFFNKVKPVIYYTFTVLIIAIGGLIISQYYSKDPMANDKIAVYNEALNVVATLSSSSKLSEEYINQKTELDKLINVKSVILKDSTFKHMLVMYYYYLEQYERDSEVERPTIQAKSIEIAEYGASKIKSIRQ